MRLSTAGNPRVTLDIPEKALVGSPVPITMRIENTSATAVELYLRGREPTYDFIVSAPGGDVVWRRLDGEVVQAILRLEHLLPGVAMEFSDSWDQRDGSGEQVRPGVYTVRGALLSESPTLESPGVPLRINWE